jgi:hypothetical protein
MGLVSTISASDELEGLGSAAVLVSQIVLRFVFVNKQTIFDDFSHRFSILF